MPKNIRGMKVQCGHCGYTWLTNSERAVTSCPKCGWRVRLRRTRRGEHNIPAGDIRPREPPRYY